MRSVARGFLGAVLGPRPVVTSGLSVFETALGRCGIAWNARGITALRLPEANDEALCEQLREREPGASLVSETRLPKTVRRAVQDIVAAIAGEPRDLRAIVLDFEGVPPFHRKVYEAARRLGYGQTCSYGQLAQGLGSPGASRAVGQALGRNPFAVIVPCHRVLAAGGKLGGFTAHGGVRTKEHLLGIERGMLMQTESLIIAPAPPQLLAGKPGPSGFSFDPLAAVRALSAADPKLGGLIARVGPFALSLNETPSVFVALVEAIVHQQLTGKAAQTIFGRVCDLFGGKAGLEPTALVVLKDEQLRGAGLSRAKVAALRDLAEHARQGLIPNVDQAHGLEDEALVAQLSQVRGVGRWTVQMLLMFRLGRGDVLPVDDFGIQKGFGLTFSKGAEVTRAQITERAERWRPYRSVASWYLWRAVDLAKASAAQPPTGKKRPPKAG